MAPAQSDEAQFKWVLDQDLRILVIDDDPIMREFATVYLSAPSVTVEVAEDGESGLARLATEKFDVALIDIDMPGINGYEVLRRIRADMKLRQLPAIIVTSNEDIASIDKAYDLGATSFVTKPVNWRVLSYHVRFVMRAAHKLAA
jgi:CheY-like chemotaxis protein